MLVLVHRTKRSSWALTSHNVPSCGRERISRAIGISGSWGNAIDIEAENYDGQMAGACFGPVLRQATAHLDGRSVAFSHLDARFWVFILRIHVEILSIDDLDVLLMKPQDLCSEGQSCGPCTRYFADQIGLIGDLSDFSQ